MANATTPVIQINEGNVGIGTASPGAKLDVQGTILVNNEIQFVDGNMRIFRSSNDMRFRTGGSDKMTILSGGNVGIGATGPTAKLHVLGGSNDTIDETTANFKVQGGGGNGTMFGTIASSPYTSYIQSAYVVDTSLAQYNLALNPIGGNVGIGTTSPDGNLEVITSTIVSGASDTVNNVLIGLQAANRPTIILDTADTTYTNRTWNITNVGSAGKLFIGRNGLDVMVMDNSGNVGIGTTSPNQSAAASSSTVVSTKAKTSGGVAITELIGLANNDNDKAGLISFISQNATSALASIRGLRYTSDTTGKLAFFTSGTEKMRIDYNGNVGIGTTAPDSILHVNGYRLRLGDGASDSKLWGTPASGGNFLIGQSSNTGRIKFVSSADSDLVTILNGGNVGIGTSSPATQLHVESDNPIITLQRNNNGNASGALQFRGSDNVVDWQMGTNQVVGLGLEFNFQNSNKVYIETGGNVGIGTTTPGNKLHVVEGTSTWEAVEIQSSSTTGCGVTLVGANTSVQWSMIANASNGGAGANNLGFHLTNAGSSGGSNGYKMTIQASSGNVGIGTTSPTDYYPGADNLVIKQASGEGGMSIVTANDTSGAIYFADGTTGSEQYRGGIGYTHSTDKLFLVSGGQTRAWIDTNGNVGIGENNPTSLLHLKKASGDPMLNIQAVSAGDPGITFTSINNRTGNIFYSDGTTNAKLTYDHADTSFKLYAHNTSVADFVLNETTSYFPTQNVGIGVTSPNQKLHVNDGGVRVEKNATGLGGFITIGNATETAGNYSAYFFGNTPSDTDYFKGGIAYETLSATFGRGDMHFLQNDSNDATSATISDSVMTILNGGNVGIGTTSPGVTLDVIGNVRSYESSGNYGQIANGSFQALGAHGGTFMLDLDNTGSADLVNIKKSGSSRFYIENGGNVGIGTTSPGATLDVNGATYVRNVIYGYAGAGNQYGGLSWNSTDDGFLFLKSANVTKVNINSNGNSYFNGGNVGIGTTSPLSLSTNTKSLTINSTRNDLTGALFFRANNSSKAQFYWDSSGLVSDTISGAARWYTGSTERMRITSAGNVGIGTTSPVQKLQVNGSVYSNGGEFFVNTNSGITAVGNLIFKGHNGTSYFEGMRLASTGNVGIGVTGPTTKLDVGGSVRIAAGSNLYFTSSNTTFKIQQDTTNSELDIYGGALVPAISIDNSSHLALPGYGLSGSGTPIKLLGLDSSSNVVTATSFNLILDDTPAASTTSGSGNIVNWSVSETVTAGTLYAVKTNGGWTIADADSEAKSTYMLAIALGSNATAGMLLQGFFYKSSHGFTIGAPLYVSNTAGSFSNSRPTGSGDYVRIIGYATSTNYIYFDPDKTWVKIA